MKIIEWIRWLLDRIAVFIKSYQEDKERREQEQTTHVLEEIAEAEQKKEEYDAQKLPDNASASDVVDFWNKFGVHDDKGTTKP